MAAPAELQEVIREAFPKVGELKHLQRPGAPDGWAFQMSAGKHAEVWLRLWKRRAESGYYPLMTLYDRYDPESASMMDIFRKNPLKTVLRKGLALNAGKLLKTRAAEHREDLGNRVYRGAWPRKAPPRRGFSSKTLAITRISRAKSLWIVMLPVRTSWEAIAYHYWGGWNDAPCPEEQVVMLKSWNERFGAEWALDGGDSIELYCARPPETREAAMKLAREQFVFCLDIVDQGCETVERLAFELLGSRRWFFWWD